MSKIEVQKIEIKIGDKTISLSPDELREFRDVLDATLSPEPIQAVRKVAREHRQQAEPKKRCAMCGWPEPGCDSGCHNKGGSAAPCGIPCGPFVADCEPSLVWS